MALKIVEIMVLKRWQRRMWMEEGQGPERGDACTEEAKHRPFSVLRCIDVLSVWKAVKRLPVKKKRSNPTLGRFQDDLHRAREDSRSSQSPKSQSTPSIQSALSP